MRNDIHIVLDSTAIMGETPLKNDPRCHELRLSVRNGKTEWRDGERSLAEMFSMKFNEWLPKDRAFHGESNGIWNEPFMCSVVQVMSICNRLPGW